MTDATMPAAAPRRPRLIAAVVAVAFFMQMLDGTIIGTSLPAMAADFGTDPVSLNIGFTAYLLAMAVCIAPAGWLADRFGSRTVFILAIVVFAAASLACALSASLAVFAAARVLQGAAAALMTPVGRRIVLTDTPKSQLVHAIALITWPALLAPVIGPVLGGWITMQAGWRWNFLVNLPLAAVGVALVFAFLPSGGREARRPFDAAGLFWTGSALSGTLLGLEFLSQDGGIGPGSVLMLLLGLAAGAMAVRHLRRARHPIIDLSVLEVGTFATSALGPGTASRIAINAPPFLLPLLFQLGFGLDAIATGTLILVYFLGNLAMKSVTTPMLRLFGFRRLLVVNGALSAASIAAFALMERATPYPVLAIVLFAAGLTRSMQFTALNTIAFADIAAHQRGAATTLSSMTQQLSQVLAVSLSAVLIRLSAFASADAAGSVAMLENIRVAFVVMGIVGLVSALRFLKLSGDAGAEVSGHAAVPAAGRS